MKNFYDGSGTRALGVRVLLVVCLLALAVGVAQRAVGQVVEAADAGGVMLSVGGSASGYTLAYGERKMLGATAFIDADTRRHIGIEGEARWLFLHQTADVHAETYMMGLRYHRELGRFQPYVKGLAGVADFNFPYDYAHGSYLAVAPGAGLDYRLNHRFSVRVADFEYQRWHKFTFGPFSSVGVSCGIRFRIF